MRIRSTLSLNSINLWTKVISLLWLALVCPALAEQSLTVSWPPNPEPNIAGYNVYYGAASGSYTNGTNVGNVTTNIVPGLVEGVTYYFVVTAYDTLGLESSPSIEVSNTIPVVVPPKYTPVAGTLTPTLNGSTGAVLKAAVNPNGAETVAWFQYGYDNKYGWTTGRTNLGSGASTIWINAGLSGLTPGQTYHYRVVASNSVGVTNGTDMTFTMPASLPALATQPATAIQETGATLNAVVNPNGGASLVWFEYGTNSSYGNSTAGLNVPAGNSPVPLNVALTGLTPGATYHFRAAAKNSAGIAYGADLTFATPQVFSGTSVTLTWPRNPEMNIVGYFVYYGVASGVYTNDINVGNVTNYTVSGLVSGVTYYFNVTAYDDLGLESDFTGEVSATTGAVAGRPVIGTVSVVADTTTSAQISALVKPSGAGTTVWFEHGATTNYSAKTAPANFGASDGDVNFTAKVINLAASTTYHGRVVASNSVGVTYGGDVAFTTLSADADVTTLAATAITSTKATLQGTANPNNTRAGAWFEYGLTTNYGVVTAVQDIGAGNAFVQVSYNVANLQAGQTWHFRLVATNGGGISYGADMTFATPNSALSATTLPARSVRFTSAALYGSVTPGSYPASAYFEYGTTTNLINKSSSVQLSAGTTAVTVNKRVSNLNPGATYYYRVVATNKYDKVYGQILNFKTR